MIYLSIFELCGVVGDGKEDLSMLGYGRDLRLRR